MNTSVVLITGGLIATSRCSATAAARPSRSLTTSRRTIPSKRRQVYLRAQSTAYQGGQPLSGVPQWTLTAPSLLDVYLDARPNPRVRAFVLGRMSFDPTAPSTSSTHDPGDSRASGRARRQVRHRLHQLHAARGPASLLDQMWIPFDIEEKVFVTAGKQHVRWGTGRFWQPTDYLHSLKRNPLDVFDARGGTRCEAPRALGIKGWNFYGVAVTEDPTDSTAGLNQVAAGGRAEMIVLGAEVGIDGLFKRGRGRARGSIFDRDRRFRRLH